MKQKIQLKTPITYYGGKQKMLEYILPLIPEHRIYSEAFFGGGAVFWAKEPAKVEFINDHNGEVINFYRVLKQNFQKLKQEIDMTLHSEFQHRQAKSIYQNPGKHDEIKRAWAVWVLSHQSFYSILGSSWKCSKSRSVGSQICAGKELFTDVYLWTVWQMLRSIDLIACPNLMELKVFGNLLLDDIRLNIANPDADMNNIISRTVDLPGGVMKVTRETVVRKNYAEFEDRMQSLGYKITLF